MPRFLKSIAVATTAALTFGVLAATTPPASATVPVNVGVRQAASYASAHGVRAGVAVLDLRTGRFYGSGSYNAYFGSASVMKLFVATRLLATGQMVGWKASTAYQMITRSDDAALTRLLPYVGGTGVINWIKSYYKIPFLGTTPSKWYCWGNEHITARGMVYFYRAMTSDSRVSRWLVNALHHRTYYGSDGTNQNFGIPSATSGAAVKQGWGACSSDMGGSIINTTGLVNGDRYAVAILTETRRGSINRNTYNGWQAGIATTMARYVLPGRYIDLPERHNPVANIARLSAVGNLVTISGWSYDPDHRATPQTVRLYDGSKLVYSGYARTVNAATNKALKLAGGHNYSIRFYATNAVHTLCVYTPNVSYGTAGSRPCIRLSVSGRASGVYETATVSGGRVQLTGWAYDPDGAGRSTNIQVREGDKVIGTYAADRYRADVNKARRITGNHGFAVTLPATIDGRHTYRVYAVNYGSSYSPWTNFGARAVTVANMPAAAVEPSATPTD